MILMRVKASLIHLTASLFAAALVYAWVVIVWFPGALFGAAAGKDLMQLMIAVDVVLGPVITLIIFNPLKTSLKKDLAVIVAIQVLFLFYGVWSIYSARPVYMAFVENRFYLVTANEIDPLDQAKAVLEFQSMPSLGPILVGTEPPKDQKILQDLMFAGLRKMGIQNLPQYFLPFSEVAAQVVSRAASAEVMTNATDPDRKKLLEFEREHKNAHFIPLFIKTGKLFLAIDKDSGALLKIL